MKVTKMGSPKELMVVNMGKIVGEMVQMSKPTRWGYGRRLRYSLLVKKRITSYTCGMTILKHVIFDGFGTLVHRKCPMSFAQFATEPTEVAIDWKRAMTAPSDWLGWAASIGQDQALAADLSSIVLYKDIPRTLRMLDYAGIRFSVMSNLASCYGAPLQQALAPFDVHRWFLSYADGMKKPDPRYYEHALGCLDLSAGEVMFVGDHAKHDVLGPALVGLNAMRVRREHISMDAMLEPWCL